MSEKAFTAQAVREQLGRIVANSEFAQSPRMCRFLRLAVEYSLEGRAGELKEYLIGIEVFDRQLSFDPRVDPIVRVEARRLRLKLEKYYKSEGAADRILVALPKGRYAASFSAHDRQDGAEQPVPAAPGTVVVLPLSNLSNEEGSEYFSDGLTQELIHGLTRVQGLRVVAWNSAARLRGMPHDPQRIGRELGVSSVLTGSVRRAANRIRITVQLVETSTGYYLWSEAYDRELEDLLQIQDEISRAIITALRIRLADHLHLPAVRKSPFHFEAHNHYLKGRFHWNKRTPEGLTRAVEYFEQAVALDAGFALGWAGLADAHSLLAEYGAALPSEALPKAKRAALRAIDLNPTLGEAWTSLALIVSLHEWKWEEGEAHYRRAIELNPGYATVHMWYSLDFLALLGRLDEAREEIRIACQLDPWSPMNVEGSGFIHLLAGRFDEAILAYREALKLDPAFYKAWTSIGRALIHKGEYDEAVEMLEKGRTMGGDIPSILGALGQAHALAGRTERARCLLEALSAKSKERYVASTCFAMIHMGLGEKDEALTVLEGACERNELPLASLKVHPAYESLRGEPRFAALLRRLRLDVNGPR